MDQPKIIEFFVPGKPVPEKRVRFSRGRVHPDRRTAKWKEDVAWSSKQSRPDQPLKGPLAMHLIFYFIRPKSTSQKTAYAIAPGDADNFAKSIMDALQKSFYKNDNQVVYLGVSKQYSPMEGVSIQIIKLSEGKNATLNLT